jgi:hypothetical protein
VPRLNADGTSPADNRFARGGAGRLLRLEPVSGN